MVTKIAAAFANIFMAKIEKEILRQNSIKPIFWKRFIYDVIDKPFAEDGLNAALSECFFFYFSHEDVSKGYGDFRAHGCYMGLKIIFLVKLERVF